MAQHESPTETMYVEGAVAAAAAAAAEAEETEATEAEEMAETQALLKQICWPMRSALQLRPALTAVS